MRIARVQAERGWALNVRAESAVSALIAVTVSVRAESVPERIAATVREADVRVESAVSVETAVTVSVRAESGWATVSVRAESAVSAQNAAERETREETAAAVTRCALIKTAQAARRI